MLRAAALISLIALLVVHLALRGETADLDAPAYLDWYWHVSKLTSEEFFGELGWYSPSVFQHLYEWGFASLGWAFATAGASETVFLGSVAALSLGLKVRPLLVHSPAPFLALLWYVSFSYILLEMNAMRAGVAAGFLLLAVSALIEQRRLAYLLFVFLACAFHISAVIGLLFPVLTSPRLTPRVLFFILAASIPIGYVSILDAFRPIGEMVPKLGEYLSLLEFAGVYEEINRFNVISLARLGLALALLWNFRRLAKAHVGIRAFVLSQAIYFALASVPVVGSRLSQLMGVLDVLAVPAVVKLGPRSLWTLLFLGVCAVQFYLLTVHFQLADFFYFVGEPKVVIP